MSALDKMLAKSGLESAKPKAAKKSDMVVVAATADVSKKIDRYLELVEISNNAATEIEVVSSSIREFATDYIIKNHETENLIMSGSTGEINVNMKDQYNVVKTKEQHDAIVAFLNKRKVEASGRITEESSVKFDFNKLTEEEQGKLMNFLTKELGAERYAQVVTTSTTYKLSNLKDEMIRKCKSVKEFQEFRELTSHYNITIAKRITK